MNTDTTTDTTSIDTETDPHDEPRPEAPVQAPWAKEPEVVVEALDTTAGGLSQSDSDQRLQEVGPNQLPEPARKPAWLRFLGYFDDILIYILLVAAVLKAITADWVDFTVILVVAVANAVIGFVQEGRAQNALASLRTMLSPECQVRRDGEWVVIEANDLVPGDVVRVRSGDRVPADVRLIKSSNLQIDESALTGESVPATKSVDAVGEDAGIGDRSSMLFSSTIVTEGNADGVVVATGAGTEIGRISELVADTDTTKTPLSRQLARLTKQLSIIIGAMAGIMLIIGRLVHDFEIEELISAAIAFAVAAVPEGLPALVTITLALGVQQMARRKAITRKMGAVETLGSVTTICSDKTGTLTQNEMTARVVQLRDAQYKVSGTGYKPEGEITTSEDEPVDLEANPPLSALLLAMAVCNDARVEQTDDGWRVVGQPTEGALDVLAAKVGVDADSVERLAQVPFESTHKFAATLDQLDDGSRVIHVVGAPDRLLDRSDHEFAATRDDPTRTEALDRQAWEDRIDDLSAQGLRILAAAYRNADDGDEDLELDDVEDGLTFLGVVGIVDPPRPEVTQAIKETHEAGIRVKMITGDHAGTAVAIARELGIAPSEGEVNALTGAELEQMSQEDLRQQVRDVDVYARTSPEHKLRIVRALQSHQEVVAMTGDGVNDAPSITRANVGIAMGIKGTEATKEAADIVLADDNFATIERAVEEGRRIYDNIRKSVVFLLPTNGAQSLVILIAVLFGWALPLSPVQILWVNLVTAVTLSLALAGEPAEPGIMQRNPRSPKEQVLSRKSLVMVAVASLLIGGSTLMVFAAYNNGGSDFAVAQTTAVTMLALGQLAFLFSCRFLNSTSFTPRALTGNRSIWISTGVLIVAQLIFTYAPFMNAWFDSAPIGIREWGIGLAGAIVVFGLTEATKAVLNRPTRSAT